MPCHTYDLEYVFKVILGQKDNKIRNLHVSVQYIITIMSTVCVPTRAQTVETLIKHYRKKCSASLFCLEM